MGTTSSTHIDAPCNPLLNTAPPSHTTPGLPLAVIHTVPRLTLALMMFLGPPDSGSIFDLLFSDSDDVMGPGRGRH